MTPKTPITLAALALSFTLIGCEGRSDERAKRRAEVEAKENAADQGDKVSIIRPEVEAEQNLTPREPLEDSISFADNGTKLNDAAKAQLDEIAQSNEARAGGDITLRGHTDSSGGDDINRRISTQRAEAVRDYLVTKGIAPKRIRVIGVGEGRPIAPNATLDGEPDEAGQAKNRRVDIVISVPASEANDAGPETDRQPAS